MGDKIVGIEDWLKKRKNLRAKPEKVVDMKNWLKKHGHNDKALKISLRTNKESYNTARSIWVALLIVALVGLILEIIFRFSG